jgi:hypothetical protein
MSVFRMSAREKALARIAPITDKPGTDRRMRIAVLRAQRKGPEAVRFEHQQAFDRSIATLVQNIPVSAEIAEWFRNEKLIPQKRRGWKKAIRNPVVHTIALALLVIAGVLFYTVMERVNEFPGAGAARKMLTVAASIRGVTMDPIDAPAGKLGDLFFMKYRLEHYDVPAEFAELRASSWRVFDDDEGRRIAQITIPEQRMQLFLFPSARNPNDAKPMEFEGWEYIDHEGWSGVVRAKSGVCFMAAVRGDKTPLKQHFATVQADPPPKSPTR